MKSRIVITLVICFFGFLNPVVAQKQDNSLINEGPGSFIVQGSGLHESDTITIHYYKPKNFTPRSKILMVIPGAGRNGDTYRDSWTEASEKYSVLIISLSYPEATYPYSDYHLGNLVTDLNLYDGVRFVKNSNQVQMDEDIVKFKINYNSKQWIYNDFDRIFNMVKEITNSKQKQYDMFGHSAGGQILHRFALMKPKSKANKILASNAGTYTLPDYNTKFPFGLKNLDNINLKKAFKKKLVLFLGELDNEFETGGILLRSKTVDLQGTNRLARGKYFYNKSLEAAKNKGYKLNWKLEIIPNIGHNQKGMARAAAKYLYE